MLLEGGPIDCWGSTADGVLGSAIPVGPVVECAEACSYAPVRVNAIPDATTISTGRSSVCALLSGGGVECWGSQLGNGANEYSATPVAVSGITNATSVAVGSGFGCAVLTGGRADCWGDNQVGELGDATTKGPSICDGLACSLTPVPVGVVTSAIAISASDEEACALLSAGGVDCWGRNGAGQLGNGTTANSATPVPVRGL